jgi:hypothetical protein
LTPTPHAPLPDVVLYGRPGCHLCDDAHANLVQLLARRAEADQPVPALTKRNIEDDESWHRRYLFTIPVLAIGARELELATTAAKISRFLTEVLDDVRDDVPDGTRTA